MHDLTLIRSQLADARASYHRLMTGQAVNVFVDQNGERIQYTMQNRADLYGYILRLQSCLPCGTPDSLDLKGFAPLRPYF